MLEELHTCVDNLEIKCRRIPANIAILGLYTMYFEPDDVTVLMVPDNLQLHRYFALYEKFIAPTNFIVSKNMTSDVMRTMWFYGVNNGHSFSNYSGQIRYNVVIITFLSKTCFDTLMEDIEMTDPVTVDNCNAVANLHSQSTHSYALKTRKLACSAVYLPYLNKLYLNPLIKLPTVPADLQLPLFSSAYNDIARARYVITKDLHVDLVRLM